MAGDSDDKGGEDEGDEDAFDESEEDIGDDLEVLRFFREQGAEDDTEDHREDDPLGEGDFLEHGDVGVGAGEEASLWEQ